MAKPKLQKNFIGFDVLYKLTNYLYNKKTPVNKNIKKELDIIRTSEYFDPDWYLSTYLDVANEGLDPALHYLLHGGLEGRDPGPHFSSKSYLSSHKNGLNENKNPLVHFLETGMQFYPTSKIVEVDQKEVDYIRNSNLFNEAWYKNSYGNKIKDSIDAATHYYLYGSVEKLDPSPQFSTEFYLKAYETVASGGFNALVHYEKHGKKENLIIEPARDRSAFAQIDRFYSDTRGLQIFKTDSTETSVSLVTDSISRGSLFGGVGTAIIFGAMLAQKMNRQFIIITRQQEPDRSAIRDLFYLHNIKVDIDIKFIYASINDQFSIIFASDNDIYITTSWWTTQSSLQSVDAKNIIYLIQEDERMFYPFGMNRLVSSETMSNKNINIVVNSHLLYQHLVQEGILDMRDNVQYFEPAFPEELYNFEYRPIRDKLNFGFYARPYNDRNLYIRGLEVIDEACANDIIDPRQFNIIFFGKDLEPLSLGGKTWPRLVQNVSWREYSKIVQSLDLCLSLMYTPHPSYPPLDVASSGGVVVTNYFGLKDGASLARYSENILSSSLDKSALAQTLKIGVELSKNRERRLINYKNNKIERSWKSTLDSVINKIAQRIC